MSTTEPSPIRRHVDELLPSWIVTLRSAAHFKCAAKQRPRIAATVIVLTLFCQQPLWGDDAQVPRFALLVGVAKYAHLPPADQLDGCVNDVEATAALLKERFGFRDDQIVTLVNEAATGEAIREQLALLAKRIKELPADSPTAQVMFHYSGHGSQLPDQPDGPDRDEHDGLDETLVPFDATKQGGPEDIRDDELFRYVSNICADGKAQMWIVLDCCHSGTGVRGSTKVRKLTRNLTANVPTPGEAANIVSKRLPAGAVALYACRDNQVEPEYDQGTATYGLLTRFLVQVLSEQPQLGSLSYEQVCDAVINRYQQDASVIRAPVPQLEGAGALLRSPVLSATSRERPPYWEVIRETSNRGEVLIKAGAFHGVTPGSIFELYGDADAVVTEGALPATGNNGDSIAWLRIEKAEGTTARAATFRWDGDEPADVKLPSSFKRGYAIERYHQHGDFTLRLKVVVRRGDEDEPLLPGSPQLPPVLATALNELQQPGESDWLRWVNEDEPCDLVLRLEGSLAALFPATGVAHVEMPPGSDVAATSLLGGWGPPFDLSLPGDHPERGIGLLGEYLRRITRARNLIRLVSAQSSGSHNGPQVDLELLRVDADGKSVAAWETRPEDRSTLALGGASAETNDTGLHVMRDRDLFAFRVSNREATGKPVFVSVLLINVDMGIEQILPWQHGTDLIGDNRIPPGEHVDTLPAFECNGEAYADDAADRSPAVYGRRWAVMLATREPNQFYRLAQPSLPRVSADSLPRLVADGTRSGPPGSLEKLLLQETYFQTRARRRRPQKLYDDSWSAAIVQWQAIPPAEQE